MPANHDATPSFEPGRSWHDGDTLRPGGRRRVLYILLRQLGGYIPFGRGVPCSAAQPDVRPARMDGRPKPAGVGQQVPQQADDSKQTRQFQQACHIRQDRRTRCLMITTAGGSNRCRRAVVTR